MMRTLLLLLLFVTAQSCNTSSVAGTRTEEDDNLKHTTFVAVVDRIIDGDTMIVLYKGKRVRIRLTHIDAPENRRTNPISKIATATLTRLCADQEVTVLSEGYDRYQRLLAEIQNADGKIVNQEMVRLGMAIHYKRYSSDSTYAALEDQAKQQQIGLWSIPQEVVLH